MFPRLSVCATVIFYQLVFTAPFSEKKDVDKIEAPPKSNNLTEWTDIYYDNDVRGGPEYLEYDPSPIYAKNNTYIDSDEETMNYDDDQNEMEFSEYKTKRIKNMPQLLSYIDENTEVIEDMPIKKKSRMSAVEADEADQQIDSIETQNDNIKTLDDTDHQTHTLLETNNNSTKNTASQEPYKLNQEVNMRENDIYNTFTAKVISTPLPKTQNQSSKYAKATKTQPVYISLSMKHVSVTTTTNQANPTQPPYTPKVVTNHSIRISELYELYSSIDMMTENPKSVTTKDNTYIVQSIDYQNDKDKVKEKVENPYDTVIQEQLARTEHLLRKMEAASNSELVMHHSLARNSYSATQNNNTATGDTFREGDTQPSRSTTPVTKDDAPHEPDKVVIAQNTSSPNRVSIITDNTKQQTNVIPLIDKVILENNMFKLVQPQQSSSLLPTASKRGKPNKSISGMNKSYSVARSTPVPQQLGIEAGTGTFNSSKLIELPNGSWTPSCKYVTKGTFTKKKFKKMFINFFSIKENIV